MSHAEAQCTCLQPTGAPAAAQVKLTCPVEEGCIHGLLMKHNKCCKSSTKKSPCFELQLVFPANEAKTVPRALLCPLPRMMHKGLQPGVIFGEETNSQ